MKHDATDAIVVGGGIAGLASAIGLRRAGWSVRVLERAAVIEPLGAALSLWDNAMTALVELGVRDRVAAHGEAITSLLVADRRGRAILGPQRVPGEACMITRADLQRALAAAAGPATLELGQEVAAAEEKVDRVTIRLRNGDHHEAALLIDAGGIWSPLANGAPATHRGYGGVLALSDAIDAPLQGVAAEYWGDGERFGLFELPAGRRYWFYMRDGAADSPLPAYDDVARRSARFPPAIAEAVAATPSERLIPFAIHAKPPPKHLAGGRIVHVGDAAHAMEPNLGQGACQALEDAAILSMIASRTPPARVASTFERVRRTRVRWIVRRAAEGRIGAHGSGISRALSRSLLRLAPSRVHAAVIRAAHTMPLTRGD